MRLYVDIGNSRTKLVEKTLGFGYVTAVVNDLNNMSSLLSSYIENLSMPDKIIVSNVAGEQYAKNFTLLCEEKWAISPQYLNVTRECLGVQNSYVNINQFGVDRWAAIVAAWNQNKSNLLVVDCGTAVTADIVLHSGIHQGGYIIPGVKLMIDGLTNFTDNISSIDIKSIADDPGKTTEECVTNGSCYAVVAFIEKLLNDLNIKSATSFHCIITGGGSAVVMNGLSIPFTYAPNLVFEGMEMISGVYE
ncbi:MAG: type III pantothenate kinase [Gammaproteobacteria bacterium]|jgi:type III pantothenate kinase